MGTWTLCGASAWPRWSNRQDLGSRLLSLPACPLRGAVGIRALRPDDAERLREFVLNPSAASRMARFHAVLQDLSPSLLARLLRTDPRECALVATRIEGEREQFVGEARYAVDEDGGDPHAREFAIAVADDRRGRGLATTLLSMLAMHARHDGVRLLYGDLVRDNRPMLNLARKLGFSVRMHPGDARLQRVELRFHEASVDDDVPLHAGAVASAVVFPA